MFSYLSLMMHILAGKALQGGNHWYFFSQAVTGVNKISPSGYWMPAGARETITSSGRDVGIKTTLVFYIGEAPHGVKTNWVMHEYRLLDGVAISSRTNYSHSSSSMKRGSKKRSDVNLVVCRVHEASFFHVEETELSCLDEVFLSLDDLDEISMP
ncbi:hypothetical protein Cni_G05110 [Canna indica]|uniref:NAC domain-containing protein n=1 Tax=Canna indica TaxID=4628 RepID=A0AAQ3JVY5_9LILI|nr:hypothetical protein Cni_G05110 [Canna indica]